MSYIQVYFNEVLQGEVEVRPDPSNPVSIGRAAENDVSIDNAGISALHAILWKEGDRFVLADTASTNGVLVDGEATQRKVLEFGDEFQILKYTFKFAKDSVGVQLPESLQSNTQGEEQKTTIEVDVATLNDLVKQRVGDAPAYLRWSRKDHAPSDYPLNKVHVKIGRAKDCEIRTTGWLKPHLSATIVHRSDGYHLKPENGASIKLNQMRISESRRLRNGDKFAISGCSLTFYERISEQRQPDGS